MGGPCFVTGWALEANYPAGSNAWNAQPCKVVPTGDIFIPGTPTAPKPLPAEWLNYLFNEYAVAIQGLQLGSYTPALQNWGAEQGQAAAPFNPAAFLAACWDPTLRRTLLCGSQGPGGPGGAFVFVWASYGMDGNAAPAWFSFPGFLPAGGSLNTNAAVCADPNTSGYYWVAYGSATSSGQVPIGQYNASGALVTGTTYFNGVQLPLFPNNTLLYTQLHSFNGTVYITIGSTVTTGAYLFQAGSSTNLIGGATGATGLMLMADNAANGGPNNLLIAMPTQAGSNEYWTSPDGATWTQRNLGGIVTGGQNVFGLVWTQDAVGPCWLLGINGSGGGGRPFFYRSADGVIWTVQAGPNSLPRKGTSMACIGGSSAVYVSFLDVASGGLSAGQWSADGGATWYQGPATLTSNLATGVQFWTPQQVVASDVGLFMFNSLWFRFSQLAGVPAAHL